MAGSLLDNDDFSSIGSSRGSKGGGGLADSATVIKIVVIVVCLLGAGGLFAFQMGVFDKKPQDVRTDTQVEEDEVEYQKQERFREKLKELPEYQTGDA